MNGVRSEKAASERASECAAVVTPNATAGSVANVANAASGRIGRAGDGRRAASSGGRAQLAGPPWKTALRISAMHNRRALPTRRN